MSVTMPETSVPTTSAPTTSHPTVCPPWCKHRDAPASHTFGPTVTWHFSRSFLLPAVASIVAGEDTMMRVELVREDEGDEIGATRLAVAGESESAMDPAEADIWLAHLTAFMETARVLRSQMGA